MAHLVESCLGVNNMNKENAITSDLFKITDCEDCKGTGQSVDKAPKDATYELYEDCETCNGTGAM